MPEGFLFDAVACSRWRRGDRMLRRRIEALPMDAALYTSVISVGELTFGIHNARPLRLPLHEVVPLMAELLAVPLPDGRYPPLHLTPLQQRQQTYDALVAWMLEEAERQPVLVVWEDLHWADPSTLELLGLHIDQTPTAPLCHLLTFRPEFVPPWPTRSHMTPLTLNRLERLQTEAQIAQLLEARFPETVAAEPELLAHHYTEAGCHAQAVGYWQQAGTRALQRSANVEAIAHVQRGLELLTVLPDTSQRTQHELDLLTTLGPALMSTKGYAAPEVVQVYTRARELCQQIGETPEHFPVLWNLWLFYVARAEHQTAMELGEQCLQLAQRVQDEALLLEAHCAIGVSWFYLGNLALACTHLEHAIALYDPEQHHVLAYYYGGLDPGWVGFLFYAWALWLRGYPAQARAQSAKALSLAQHLAYPYLLARALYYDALLCQLRRDVSAVRDQTEAALTIATAQSFALVQTGGLIMRGWAITVQEHSAEGLVQIRQGLDMYCSAEAKAQRPHFLTLLAEAAGLLGQPEDGLAALDEALPLVEKTGERYYEAELHRQRGELLLLRVARSHPDQGSREQHEAETCFQHALDVARGQQAKSLELRAAMSLARLWQRQGKRVEAHALLEEIYGWFTEGFDTADLQEARALLDALA